MVVLRRVGFGLSFAFGATIAACDDPLVDYSSTVAAPRVLAVRVEPAEAAPGEIVSVTALIAGPSGTLTDARPRWGLCNERKPLADPGPVSPLCARNEGILAPVGEGLAVSVTLPKDACRLFGPDRPPPKDGEPAGRPVDPDPTGGFYQPLFLQGAPLAEPTLAELRVVCGIGAAPQAEIVGFGQRYKRNTNPTPGEIVAPPTLPAGQRGILRIGWPDCPSTDSCGGPELYTVYDPESRTLGERRETMRVSWFATRGTFDVPRTGASDGPGVFGSTNGFTVPDEPGPLTIWVVVRDDRGGVGYREITLPVVR